MHTKKDLAHLSEKQAFLRGLHMLVCVTHAGFVGFQLKALHPSSDKCSSRAEIWMALHQTPGQSFTAPLSPPSILHYSPVLLFSQ